MSSKAEAKAWGVLGMRKGCLEFELEVMEEDLAKGLPADDYNGDYYRAVKWALEHGEEQ
ncbi:hypothetical protein [Corynebacterium sp.]|uniref:hypothetical protein n=1 Tax=Corynebacterium sp. TaxID=1720 RepID=UPI002F41A80A